jgi:microcin C transport system substrate-binding protein
LDRILQWRYYVVPSWHLGAFRIAYWDKFGRPDKLPEPTYGIGLSGWWIDPAKEKALATKIAQAAPADAAASAATSEATSAAAPAAPADRGSSPIQYVLYIGGAVVLIVIIGAMLKRKKPK